GNGDSTNEKQNIENDEGLSGSIQDVTNRNVKMLSQKGESFDVMLEEDRNEENQQKVQDNMLQQTKINANV
ncbi:8478_t:CDS:2, partial [Cetraspora pellucida]